ncbi:nucleoside recognition domain-containing protein [Marasmitruncus massiliensis]|uniref:nucleoside recognition domain-containing protein n=1 Tax=Marasmitruncus massiliensis TaxID=1944642 RepID=UPI000C7BED3A|nr:nucleoside recognition domain-containing protein [Marasmitruncus massiliensis]
MMNYIFGGMILLSFVFSVVNGRLDQLSNAALEQAGNAVELTFSLVGVLCLWSGLMKIAQGSGLTHALGKALSPITKRLFKGLNPEGEAIQAVCMNMIANFLGLGNAATPLGIQAICAMKKEEHAKRATNNMVTFVVLNTASFQLIPTTIALLRMKNGAGTPFDILPAVWVSSAVSVTVAILFAKLLAPVWRDS